MEIFEASPRGMVVAEEADPSILATLLVLQTLPTTSPCRTKLWPVVTNVKNEDTGVKNSPILCKKLAVIGNACAPMTDSRENLKEAFLD